MSRTKLRQVIQVANSEVYEDGYLQAHVEGGAEPAHPELSLEHDLNVLRTNLKNLKGTPNWFDQITSGEDITGLAGDVDDLESALGNAGTSSLDFTHDYIISDGSAKDALDDLDGYTNTLASAVASFTGMDGYSDSTPDYNSRGQGSVAIVGPNDDLELAVAKLDAYFQASDLRVTLQDAFNNSQLDNETSPEIDLGSNLDLNINGTGTSKLHIETAGGLEVDNLAKFDGTLQYTVSPTAGHFLKSDATGVSSWSQIFDTDVDINATLTVDPLTNGNTNLEEVLENFDAYMVQNASAISTLDIEAGAGLAETGSLQAGDLVFNVSTVSGETIIDGDSVGIDEAFNKTDFTSFQATSSGGINLDATGSSISLDGASGNFNASAGNLTLGASATVDIDGASVEINATSSSNLSTSSGDLTLEGGSDGYLTFDQQFTSYPLHLSTGDSSWELAIETADGRTGQNIGMMDAINAVARLADGQSLQQVYDETAGVDPDILVQNDDELNFRLGNSGSSFKVTSDDNDQIFEVTDGYVKVDGYFVVQGESFLVDSQIIDQDHLVLHPALADEVALKLEPKVSQAAYTANLMEIWDGYETIDGALVMRINDNGDAYFAKTLDVDGSSDFEGTMNLQSSIDVAGMSTLAGGADISTSLQVDIASADTGHFLESIDADGNAVWSQIEGTDVDLTNNFEVSNNTNVQLVLEDFDAYMVQNASAISTLDIEAGAGLAETGSLQAGDLVFNVSTVSGETIIDGDSVGIDEAFNKIDFTSFQATSSGGINLDATGSSISLDAAGSSNFSTSGGQLSLTNSALASVGSTDGYLTLQDGWGGQSFHLSTGDTAWSSSITGQDGRASADIGIIDAINAASELASGGTTLQVAYNNDVDGSDATIVTNATDGSVVIGGDQSLQITATNGLDVDSLADFDVSSFDVEASSGFSIDGAAASNISTSTGNLQVSASNGDLDLSASANLDLDGASVDIDSTSTISLDAAGNFNVSTSSGLLSLENSNASSVGSTDGYIGFNDGWLSDAYYLSTGFTGWNSSIEGVDGRSGNNIGILDAINAAALSGGGKVEKAVYVIGSADGRLFSTGALTDNGLDLDAASGPDRGSIDLDSVNSVAHKIEKDVEVFVNGVLQLADSVQGTATGSTADDYYVASDDLTKVVFGYALVEGDVVTIVNRKANASEDVDAGWQY